MTKRSIHWLAAIALAATATVTGAQEAADPKSSPEAMQAMLKAMQEQTLAATSTGKHHQALAKLLGDWDVEISLVVPGMDRQTSAGTATYSWLIEGRWLGQHIDGTLMGVPYKGFSMIGFDSYAKNHVVASISSLDTALIVARGVVVDPTGKTSAAYGTLDEYTTGELGKPIKVLTRMIDDDHHVIEVWDLGIGPEGAPVLEYSYRRKKG